MSSAPAGRRICFLLRVRPERAQEYRERHGAVWPEMLDALRETGWRNYSHLPARRRDSSSATWSATTSRAAQAAMLQRDVNARWQAEMAPFFELEDGVAPDAAMTPLSEIFHLD